MKTIQKLISESLKANRERTAIEYNNKCITYEELEAQSHAISNGIAEAGVKELTAVGIYCEDFFQVVSSIVGILYHRCVFVPLDKKLPQGRLEQMINQAGISYILYDGNNDDLVNSDNIECEFLSVENLHESNQIGYSEYYLTDPAYIYFTSGSTGKPKGVVGRNNSLVHFINWEISEFDLYGKRFSQLTNIGFDASLRDILLPILAGGTICVSPKEVMVSGEKMMKWVLDSSLQIIHCVPSVFKVLRDAAPDSRLPQTLEYVFMAGEKIVPADLKKWYTNYDWKVNLVNFYGLTETTLIKAYHIIKPDDMSHDFVPVRPMEEAEFCILDENLSEVQKGSQGTVYIKSKFLAAGYLAEGTSKNRIKVDEFQSPYNTGDIGQELDNRYFQIIGRSDQQVKINGIRINLDEIKAQILKIEPVQDVYVLIQKDDEDVPFISAYIQGELNKDVVYTYLKDILPSFMLPTYITILPDFPLLPNGKVDRMALTELEMKQTEIVPAENKVETIVLNLASRVFAIPESKISVTANVVEVGRQSIKLMMFLNLVTKEFGVNTSLQLLFEKQTFRKLSDYIITTSSQVLDRDSEETIEFSI